MKNRNGVVIIILALVCVGIGIALIVTKKQANQRQRELTDDNGTLSNRWVTTQDELDQQKQTNAVLESELTKQRQASDVLTKDYTHVLATLAQASNNLAKTEAALKTSQEVAAKRDTKIAELEAQNQALDKHALDLSTSITNLTLQIQEVKHKLATSEGEKGFLEKELKRLMAEKAELERQFNDLAVLRAQVAKLKEELSVARRLEWIRQGLFASSEQRGAAMLMQPPTPPRAKPPKPSYDLNVEVNADGSVKIIPPLTNRPAATNPPAK
jgi:chromosome segregation ATPase